MSFDGESFYLCRFCGEGAQTRHKCIEVFAFAQINLYKSQWALGAPQAAKNKRRRLTFTLNGGIMNPTPFKVPIYRTASKHGKPYSASLLVVG